MNATQEALDPGRHGHPGTITALAVLCTVEVAVPDSDTALVLRVRAEFAEMPDMALSVREAARLFAMDGSRCRRILDTLVADGVLSTDGRVFVRVGTGRRHV
jgi:hypothetical protein